MNAVNTVNAVRIRKRLTAPIPELPELTPLVGKTVEIIVLEDAEQTAPRPAESDFWRSPSLEEVTAVRGKKPPVDFDQLKGGWPEEEVNDGFEEAVDRWRREPWRREDEQ